MTNVCAIHAGGPPNVIPGSVEIAGTIRYQDPAVRETLHSQIAAATGLSRAFGGDCDLHIQPGVLPIFNDDRMALIVRGCGQRSAGIDLLREAGLGHGRG